MLRLTGHDFAVSAHIFRELVRSQQSKLAEALCCTPSSIASCITTSRGEYIPCSQDWDRLYVSRAHRDIFDWCEDPVVEIGEYRVFRTERSLKLVISMGKCNGFGVFLCNEIAILAIRHVTGPQTFF